MVGFGCSSSEFGAETNGALEILRPSRLFLRPSSSTIEAPFLPFVGLSGLLNPESFLKRNAKAFSLDAIVDVRPRRLEMSFAARRSDSL